MPTQREHDALENARKKQAQGRGLKNSEIALLRHAEKVDAQIAKPARRPAASTLSEGDTRTALQAGKDKLSSAGTSNAPDLTAALAALTARVASLESLTTGLTRQTVTYCSGGSPTSKTILMS